jgi:hypothetical protein
MAAAGQGLNLPYGLNDVTSRVCIMSFGMFKSRQTCKAKILHVLLPVFCIANSRSVPIFEEVSSSSG